MLKSRFVSRLYWALIVVSFCILVVVTLHIGVFGQEAQALAQMWTKPTLYFYESNKIPIDQAAVWIASSVTAVTGGLAILKGFFHAEMNLPRRLQEMIDEARERHLHDRPQLLGYVRKPFETRDFLSPTILANPFAQVLRIFGIESVRTRARDVATSVERLEGELQNLASWKEDAENRKVTAHLLRGTCLAAEAGQQGAGSLEEKRLHERSKEEFLAALALRRRDLDALEGAAVQCGVLGHESERLGFLTRIIEAAEGEANRLRRGKAIHQSAVILNESIDVEDQRLARERLASINQVLNETEPEERIELAEALLFYGGIQSRRGKTPTAKRVLTKAVSLFGDHEGAVRARDALRQLPKH
jgi:hypothetical protein